MICKHNTKHAELLSFNCTENEFSTKQTWPHKFEKKNFHFKRRLAQKKPEGHGRLSQIESEIIPGSNKKCSKLIECSSGYQYFHRLLMKSYRKTRGQDGVSEEWWLIISPHPHSLFSFFSFLWDTWSPCIFKYLYYNCITDKRQRQAVCVC